MPGLDGRIAFSAYPVTPMDLYRSLLPGSTEFDALSRTLLYCTDLSELLSKANEAASECKLWIWMRTPM